MNKDSILYEEPWDYIVYKAKECHVIQVIFCKSFVDYSIAYVLVEDDLLNLNDQDYFKILVDNIRKEPEVFKNRISSNPNFKII